VERGVLKSFYYDLKTAALFGVESTGNGSRSLFTPPEPALTNLLIEPGETALADLIAGLDEGLIVDTLLGLGQGNIISGAFSNPLSLAFKIEKGRIVGRVKDVSIAGNVYDLMQNIAAVSRERQWVYSSLCLPYLLLPEMNVVSKQ
jgi:PmbA protein